VLYKINPANGDYKEILAKGWGNVTHLLPHNGLLYAICGKMHGCSGEGGAVRD
jgi:hypothetical protein